MSDLPYLSATEAISRFRDRSLSPVELMQSVIDRATAVEPTIGALADHYFDEAMDAAKAAEARYAGKGDEPRPLEGIAVAIKDEEPEAGRRCTFGSLIYADYVPDMDSPIVERVKQAGGIIHARTRTPEFSCVPFTHSKLWGVTRNPWNTAFDVGGSSGGAASSLACGTSTLAGGSDIGGSIRIPASCCGVAGFKPPFGRVPQLPPYNLDQYCHVGPLARTVSDVALFENAIAGPHPLDIVSLRPKLEIPPVSELGDIRGLKIAMSVDLGCYRVHPDVIANLRAAADAFREAGATVEEVQLGWTREQISTAANAHFAGLMGEGISRSIAEHGDLMTDYAKAFPTLVGELPPGGMYRAHEIEGELYTEFGALMERYDIFICPTLALPALEAGESYVDRKPVVEGVEIDILDHLMTIPFNILSRCPVMSVPSGFSRDGVPTGMQIVGRTYDDVSVFRAAAAYERVRPWMDTPDRRPRL